jgi:hypothetical protein
VVISVGGIVGGDCVDCDELNADYAFTYDLSASEYPLIYLNNPDPQSACSLVWADLFVANGHYSSWGNPWGYCALIFAMGGGLGLGCGWLYEWLLGHTDGLDCPTELSNLGYTAGDTRSYFQRADTYRCHTYPDDHIFCNGLPATISVSVEI